MDPTAVDEDLVCRAAAGDERAVEQLLARYRPLVREKARVLFVTGGDADDVLQEGFIGLYKAIVRFDPSVGASFRTFAAVCVTHQIHTAIAAARRRKHTPLNGAVPLTVVMTDEDRGEVAAVRDPLGADPADFLLSVEEHAGLLRFLSTSLTPLEREVLTTFLDGCSYDVIATRLQRSRKTVDNALQRIRHKVASIYLAPAA